MESTSKPSAPQQIAYARMQQIFERHKHKFDRHRAKGGPFAAALDDLEAKLFGPKSD